MLRAHKIRLNPTPEQEQYFRKASGTARFVYNWGLAEIKRALDDGRTPESVLSLKARFNRQLRYKAAWYGGRLVAIDRFYPLSKIHNGCGGYKADLQLSERVLTCPACGAEVDRDLNAARNIRDEALSLSASPGVATSGCQLPVDAM